MPLVQQAEKALAQRAARGIGKALEKGPEARRTHGGGVRRFVHKIAAQNAHGEGMRGGDLPHHGSEAEAPRAEHIGDIDEKRHDFPLQG